MFEDVFQEWKYLECLYFTSLIGLTALCRLGKAATVKFCSDRNMLLSKHNQSLSTDITYLSPLYLWPEEEVQGVESSRLSTRSGGEQLSRLSGVTDWDLGAFLAILENKTCRGGQ
jgi:hypothetical protein